MKFTLSKPLVTHKGAVTEIELNEPTCASFIKHSEPFKISFDDKGRPDYDFNSKASLGFLADMTGIDTILLQAMPAKDFIGLRFAMASVIFGVAGSESPTQPS